MGYLVSEGKELHDTLDGKENGEDQVAVRQDVGELQGGTVVLKRSNIIINCNRL